MNKLFEEAFEILAGNRAMGALRRDHGHNIVGRKHTFNAPGDYTPGRTDDLSKGYHKGSMIINERREVFMCVDEEEGRANWIIMGNLEDMATSESFVWHKKQTKKANTNGSTDEQIADYTKEAQEKKTDTVNLPEASNEVVENIPKPATPKNSPVKNVLEDESDSKDPKKKDRSPQEAVRETEDGTMQIGMDAGPNKGRTAIPDSMPYSGYLTGHNGLKHIEEVEQLIADRALKDLSYMSEERVEKIKEWLEG